MMRSKKNTSSRLRHRLTLQQEVRPPDGAGGYSKSWEDVVDLWAEIIPITGTDSNLSKSSGKEVLLGEQLQSEISHRILLRYRNDVTAAMRFLFGTRVFNIRYVVNLEERDETLQLLVQEGAAE